MEQSKIVDTLETYQSYWVSWFFRKHRILYDLFYLALYLNKIMNSYIIYAQEAKVTQSIPPILSIPF